LFVAIHADEPVVLVTDGELERVDEALSVALVVRVSDAEDACLRCQEPGRIVGRAVINEQNVADVLADFRQNAAQVLGLVEDGYGDQGSHKTRASEKDQPNRLQATMVF
jgi:hypothetical protein